LNSINTPASGGKLLFFGGEASDTLCAAEFKTVAAKGDLAHCPPETSSDFLETFLGLAGFSKGGPFSTS